MPRRKSVPDERVLDDVLGLIERDGGAPSFATVAATSGLSPATLVQRFGTKEAMVTAALGRAWDRLEARTEGAVAAMAPGPAGAVDLLVELSEDYDTDRYVDGLVLLREDLRRPETRARGLAWLHRLAAVVDAAVAGHTGADQGVGRLLVSLWQGELAWWGFAGQGRAGEHVRPRLEQLLRSVLSPPEPGVDRR
ncbi:hypothetical protein [Polymorphospora lycopeni]|uniref:TetR family transcriptional regulator n=1 Tax=Polymorphospora lycopeni TaxID=3140240 RepID=A0ABV5CSI0_9ACTN